MPHHADSLLAAARRWFDEETVSQVFEPLVADWQHESRARTRVGHMRWLVRGYLCFAASFIASLPRQLQRRQPDATLLSGWVATEGFAAAGVLVLLYLFPREWHPVDGAGYLLPAFLATALPLAIVPAAIVVFAVHRPSPAARAMVLRLALLVFVVLIPLVGWIAPVSNQAFRSMRLPGLESRGVRELTLIELVAERPPRDLTPPGASRPEELANRASILVMPFTLSVLGLSIAVGSKRLWLPKALLWWLGVGVVWACLGPLEQPYWIHLVLLSTAAALQRRHQRRARAARLEGPA